MSRINSTYLAAWSIVVALVAATGFAQTPEDYINTPPGPFHRPVSPYPIELGYTQHHASTATEGFLRGKAELIQAWGNFHLSTSQAAILQQQARWLDRENDLKQTQALLAQKKMWSDARAHAQKERQLRRIEGQQILAVRQATIYREAYKLSAQQLDPSTGAIHWPPALQTEEFRSDREHIEQLFQEQFAYGDPQPATASDIAHSVELWSRSLGKQIRSTPRDEYAAAQKFLMGLKYASAPTDQENVAAPPVVPRAVPGTTLADQ